MRRAERRIEGREELAGILSRADACHLALSEANVPYLVTMNYGFQWAADYPVLYFHCAPEGRKLDIIAGNPVVCFSMDTDHELVTGEDACGCGMKYRSIVGMGRLEVVRDAAERRRGLDAIMAHYAGGTPVRYDERVMERTIVLRLVVQSLEGKGVV